MTNCFQDLKITKSASPVNDKGTNKTFCQNILDLKQNRTLFKHISVCHIDMHVEELKKYLKNNTTNFDMKYSVNKTNIAAICLKTLKVL